MTHACAAFSWDVLLWRAHSNAASSRELALQDTERVTGGACHCGAQRRAAAPRCRRRPTFPAAGATLDEAPKFCVFVQKEIGFALFCNKIHVLLFL